MILFFEANKLHLGPLHMRPVALAGSVTRINFVTCLYGKFQPGQPGRFFPITRARELMGSWRAEVFLWEKFHPGYRDYQPDLTYEHIEFFYEGNIGEARSRKLSQPGWPGSYEEVLCLWNFVFEE